MSKYLVVVESPAKAKTINRFLGPDYVVQASNGHVRDLPSRDLGVDIEHNFEPKYELLPKAKKSISAIKDAAKKAEYILLASDPDREGEAIGWHVAEILKGTKKPIRRIEFNEITKRSVQEATKHPREIDENLVNAQQARRVLDRLVGYKISPLLQWSMRKGLSAGRVQSVAVRMVCDREAEIRAFVAVEYWTIDADLLTARNERFTARLNRIRGEKAEIGNEATARAIVDALQGQEFRISSVERKEVRRNPSPPFITSTLQQEASRRLGFSPRRTMAIAQQLYEGIEVGAEGQIGLITYMRTDSTRLADEALTEVRDYIRERFEPAMLPDTPNVYRSKKDAQDAHEAIRPSSPGRTPESLEAYLDKDQLRLYDLIWKRFVACQMTPAVFDQTTVDVNAKEYELRAVGTIMKFPGFTKLYEEAKDDQENGNGSEKRLPELKQGEQVTAEALRPEQHFTKPPARYTEASLIRALEENGIGRPSTYAPTINTVVSERGYVERERGRLKPTELGESVNDLLLKNFPDIMSIDFTARMEDDLDHVEEGRREWHELLREFYDGFSHTLETAQNKMVGELLGGEADCPKCGGPMEVREGRYGLFVACVKWPDCKGSRRPKRGEPEKTDEVCDKCGAQMVIREGRFGRFMACSNYPKCKNTHNVDDEGRKIERPPKEPPKKTDQKCPKCGKFLLIRTSRMGEEFYGCEGYPKCRFTKPMELNLKCLRPGCDGMLEMKRVRPGRTFIGCSKYPACEFTLSGKVDKAVPCEECGHGWTYTQKPRGKPRVRKCPVPGCGFEAEIVEEEETASE